MSKLSLFSFVTRPTEIAHGIRRLGARGAIVHGLRRTSTAVEHAILGPAQLRINPMGAICNHACGMCWLQHLDRGVLRDLVQRDKTERMNLEDYRRLFAGMPRGLTEVNIVGGGEPLVHPECVDIMEEVKLRGWRGYLITNGTLLDADAATRMVAMGWDKTRFSIHAGDRETYKAVHDVDNFERLRDNLLRLRKLRDGQAKRRCGVETHFVLQRLNLETIPRMFEFAHDVGSDYMVFEIVFALSPEFRLSKQEHRRAAEVLRREAAKSSVASNAVEIAALHEREIADAPDVALSSPRARVTEHDAGSESAQTNVAPDSADSRDDRVAAETAGAADAAEAAATADAVAADEADATADAVTAAEADATADAVAAADDDVYVPAKRCSVGFDSAFVTATGDVLPCCFSDELMGNVREQTFREIWYGATYSEFRKRLIRGQFADYCSRVRCKLRSFLHD